MVDIVTDIKKNLIETVGVKKSFRKSDHQELLVLEDVNFILQENEIVALLGKSGSGKSTLLRIIAGLIPPTSGDVVYAGKPVKGPVKGMAMVFQSFALLPWLTVLQNVELGLEAQGVAKAKRRARAIEAIDIIGLDGFESAYPKELSGGMRQRVGFARALVVNPTVLLMDEPFSALDVLTTDNLRSDLVDLWTEKKTNIKGIICVTHDIEEAAILADRILIFGANPGYIKDELQVDLPHPRNDQDPKFRKLVDDIYTLMTTPSADRVSVAGVRYKTIGLGYRLPDVEISELTGFLEALDSPDYKDKVDLPELAEDLQLNVDDLFHIIEALEIMRFAYVSKGDIELTGAGKLFAKADILRRKQIFAAHLLSYVPLARHIRRVLDERPGHVASEDRFLRELEDYLSEEAAEEVLKIVIEWGRYAEIFAYDYNTGMLSLENPE
ncbi:MAG: nitrate/sulfonate/bicarbonate ABC transporter ATP-binding protein [Gammaproteobacteria bacterium]|nr:nitrate/sulfonate/bicarbonate ABC transporter ATP-binding protein [Gammaproteobacteria bacterium]